MVDLLAAVSLAGYRYLGDATVAPIGMKFCTMVHIGPIGGGILKDKKNGIFWQLWPIRQPFDGKYLENAKSEGYMSIRA